MLEPIVSATVGASYMFLVCMLVGSILGLVLGIAFTRSYKTLRKTGHSEFVELAVDVDLDDKEPWIRAKILMWRFCTTVSVLALLMYIAVGIILHTSGITSGIIGGG